MNFKKNIETCLLMLVFNFFHTEGENGFQFWLRKQTKNEKEKSKFSMRQGAPCLSSGQHA